MSTLRRYNHAWLGNLAGRVAVPVAEVLVSCMASVAVHVLAVSVDTKCVMTRPAR